MFGLSDSFALFLITANQVICLAIYLFYIYKANFLKGDDKNK